MRLGAAPATVRSAAAAGRLFRIHRGVYAVGRPDLTREGRWMAGVLACGPGAVLSHKSAAALHGLIRGDGATTDVVLPSRARSRSGITVHTSRTLRAWDVTTEEGISVTSVARTLVDYCGVATKRKADRAVARAEELRVFDGKRVHEALARSNGRAGATRLARAVAEWEEPPFTRSVAERLLIEIVFGSRLPRPLVNQKLGTREVDLYWPDYAFAAELNSYEWHTSRKGVEHDHELSLALSAMDIRLARIGWRQLQRPTALVDDLAASLGAPRRGVRVA